LVCANGACGLPHADRTQLLAVCQSRVEQYTCLCTENETSGNHTPEVLCASIKSHAHIEETVMLLYAATNSV
jgi:hypothetical protein